MEIISFSNPDEAPPRHSIAVHSEVATFNPSQLKPPHERLRANVIRRREAQDFRQFGSDEDIFQGRGCRLGFLPGPCRPGLIEFGLFRPRARLAPAPLT